MTTSAPNANDPTVKAVVAKISTELGKFIDDTTPTVDELTENPNLRELAHSMSEQVAGILLAGHGTLSLGGKVGGAPTMAGYGTLSLGGRVGGGPTVGANGRLELSGDVADVHGTMNMVPEGVVAQITATAHPGEVSAGKRVAEPGPDVRVGCDLLRVAAVHSGPAAARERAQRQSERARRSMVRRQLPVRAVLE